MPSPQEREAIAAGYDERARLGLGSPFRLIDFALHDPRLDPIERHRIGRSILTAAARGDIYQFDPAPLNVILIKGASVVQQRGAGDEHLRLITETVTRAADPRAGAIAVRLAYQLAWMEGSITYAAYLVAVNAAVLIRDRELARVDARRLLEASEAASVDPLALVPDWRGKGYLQVELPYMRALSPSLEAAAVQSAPRLLRRIRVTGLAMSDQHTPRVAPDAWSLDAGQASSLVDAARSNPMPPRSSIVMAVRITAQDYRLPDRRKWASTWEELVADVSSEEELITAVNSALRRDPSLHPVLAWLLMRAAIGLRADAQEKPWFPGADDLSRQDFLQRHGIQVDFAGDVPQAWHSFYLRALEQSLQDLRLVFPSIELRGLRIRIPMESTTSGLASHESSKRTLEWPARTGAGSLAHEIAHDLDWQAGRRIYGRATYASLHAMSSGTPFGRALQEIIPPSADLDAERRAGRVPHSRRPVEVLARNFEWFVLTEFAYHGKSNGYLSSAQDPVLSGYGSLEAPDITDSYSRAVLTLVASLVYLPPEAKARFEQKYGRTRAPNPRMILSRFASPGPRNSDVVPVDLDLEFERLQEVRDESLAEIDAWECRGTSFYPTDDLTESYRVFVAEAAAARARGAVFERIREEGDRSEELIALREFYGSPWLSSDVEPETSPRFDDPIQRAKGLGVIPWSLIFESRRAPRNVEPCGSFTGGGLRLLRGW